MASVVGHLGRLLTKNGHRVDYFVPGQSELMETGQTKWGFRKFSLRLRTYCSPSSNPKGFLAYLLFLPLAIAQVWMLLRRHKIDLINIHYPGETSLYFAICRWLIRIPLVTSVHGADLFPKGLRHGRYPRSLQFTLRSSRRIVAPSKSLLEDFLKVFPELSGRSSYIFNGVDLEELESPAPDFPKTDSRDYLLCVASYEEKKGIDVLIRAFAQASGRDSTDLILVGDGPIRSQLEQLAKQLRVDGSIRFLGEINRATTVNLLRHCKAVILPSRFEPFGIAAVEALACKRPLIATKVGGLCEIVQDGFSGLLVEPDCPEALSIALDRLSTSPELRKNLAKNGYQNVRERFLVQHNAAAYETMFELVRNRMRIASASK